jgi:hypothetical protein
MNALILVALLQTTPCETTGTVYNPTLFATVLTDYAATLPDSGLPFYDRIEVGFFLPTVDPATGGAPVSTALVDKALLKNAGGSCYTGALASVPTAARRIATRKVRTTPEPQTGGWGPLSPNFFSLAALTPTGPTSISK